MCGCKLSGREELYTSDSDYETTVTFSLYVGNLDIMLFAPEISSNQIAAISGGPARQQPRFQAQLLDGSSERCPGRKKPQWCRLLIYATQVVGMWKNYNQ